MKMRHLHSGSKTDSGRSWSWTLLLGVALILGITFPAGSQAIADVGRDAGGDDETVGTLPICGNAGQLDLVRHLFDTHPDYYLEGSYGEILSTIVGFKGNGHVTCESRPDGKVRLGFHGQIELALDRNLLQITGIQIGASVPDTFCGAQAVSGLVGQVARMRPLRTGNLGLPVSALDAAGALGSYPWVFAARSQITGRYLLHARADVGVLYVGQTY